MTKTTFQGLVTCSIKFAAIVLEKITAIFCKLICGKRFFTSFEGRREYTKGLIQVQSPASCDSRSLPPVRELLPQPSTNRDGRNSPNKSHMHMASEGGYFSGRVFLFRPFLFAILASLIQVFRLAILAFDGFPKRQPGWAKESMKCKSDKHLQS